MAGEENGQEISFNLSCISQVERTAQSFKSRRKIYKWAEVSNGRSELRAEKWGGFVSLTFEHLLIHCVKQHNHKHSKQNKQASKKVPKMGNFGQKFTTLNLFIFETNSKSRRRKKVRKLQP